MLPAKDFFGKYDDAKEIIEQGRENRRTVCAAMSLE
jgi:hypothetical protein